MSAGTLDWLALLTLALLVVSTVVVMAKRRRRHRGNLDPAAAYRRAVWEIKAENDRRGKRLSRRDNGGGYCGGSGCGA